MLTYNLHQQNSFLVGTPPPCIVYKNRAGRIGRVRPLPARLKVNRKTTQKMTAQRTLARQVIFTSLCLAEAGSCLFSWPSACSHHAAALFTFSHRTNAEEARIGEGPAAFCNRLAS